MTVAEAARELEVTPSSVYKLCKAGLLGHMRVGVGRGVIRIDPSDLDDFKRRAREKAAMPPAAGEPGEPGEPTLKFIRL